MDLYVGQGTQDVVVHSPLYYTFRRKALKWMRFPFLKQMEYYAQPFLLYARDKMH